MEFLVIVLFVVAIVVVNFVVTRAQRRKGSASPEAPGVEGAQPDQQRTGKSPRVPRKTAGAKAASAGPRTSAEAAREANAKLNAAQHQQVYAAIAQGHPIGAVKLYAQFTGVGVRAAAAAVENLAMHPQPFQPPRPAGTAADSPAPAGTRPDAPGTPAPGSGNAETPGASADGKSSAEQAGTAGEGPVPSTEPRAEGTGAAGSAKAADAASGDTSANPSGPESSAASAGQQGGPAGRKPATPEEDEISKWVKNLRPEDF